MNSLDNAEKWLDDQILLIKKQLVTLPNIIQSNTKKLIKAIMNIIKINGKSHSVRGKNIVVKKNKLFVDNVLVDSHLSGDVKIEFFGDVASLDCGTATVTGNVLGNLDGATVKCGNVGGNVDGATVTCKDVNGSIDAATVTVKGDAFGRIDVSVKKKVVPYKLNN